MLLLYSGELYRLLGASSYGYVLGISTAMALLKTGSINCRGLSSDKIKRRDIFLKCRQNYDVSFLFDIHSKNETEPYWRSEWGNDIKFTNVSLSPVIVGA